MNSHEILRALKAKEITPAEAEEKLKKILNNKATQPKELHVPGQHYGFVVSTVQSLEQVSLQQWIVPEPGPGEITVQVKASAVNFPDTMCVKGLYPTMPDYPFVPGFEVSGTVSRVGSRVTGISAGDDVIALTGDKMGGHASFVNVPMENVIEKPADISFEDACSLPIVFGTVYYAFQLGKLAANEHVLIQTATGGCGLIAIQLANLLGCTVYGTAGRDEKLEILRKLDVPHVMNYKTSQFDREIRQITKGRGIDVVLNMLSGDGIQKGLNCLGPSGRYLEIAVHALKTSPKLDLSKLVQNQTIYSIDLRRLAFQGKLSVKEILKVMVSMLRDETVVPIVSRIYPVRQINEALEYVGQGRHIGKVIISHTAEEMTDCTQQCIERMAEHKRKNKTAKVPEIPGTPATSPAGAYTGRDAHSGEGIAVIGMSGQFPRSKDLAAFWENLARGVDCVSEVPEERWSVNRYYDPDPAAPGKTYCKWLGLLEDVDCFDPLFFNIAPAEAELMDPQQRLFLENCRHCMEDAGLNLESLSGSRCGVFVGCGPGDYQQSSGDDNLNAQALMGKASSILSARISYFLNLRGPCLAIDTACSSSLVSIAEACDGLLLGTSDIAFAGGVNVMTGPSMHIMTSKAGMLSKDGRCFTFDNRANGFVPGEGVGVLLLKRLSDAVRDRDNIYAVIRGWGINQDGKTNGTTAPSANSQVALEKDVFQRFDIDPETITLVEAHGTGTKLGDPIEVEAITEAFRSYTQKSNYCALGSVKSNIGHLLTAAGVSGAVKVLLALKHRMLPPTVHFEKLNEHIQLDESPFYVNTSLTPWEPPSGVPRRASVSSFGFSGTNAFIVFEEYAPTRDTAAIPLPPTADNPLLLVLSAKSDERLAAYARSMYQYIQPREDIAPADIAYTLQVGREAMEHRLAFPVHSREELLERLLEVAENNASSAVQCTKSKKGKEEIDALLQTKNSGEKLEQIARLWLQGQDVDWERLYDDPDNEHEKDPKHRKPRRIGLPGYPFARERYWIDQTRTRDQGSTVNAAQSVLHPLLHRNTSDLWQQRFSSTFTGREFFLAHHVVKGTPVLPGVAHLEIARAAVQQAAGDMVQGPHGIRLQNVTWTQPVIADREAVQVHIALTPAAGDNRQIDYQIYGHPGTSGVTAAFGQAQGPAPTGDANVFVGAGPRACPATETGRGTGETEAVVYSSGSALCLPVEEFTAPDLHSLQAQCNKRTLSTQQCYRAFEEMGIHYGPGHRGINQVYAGENQVLAKLSLSSHFSASIEEFVLHPGLLDSALQASLGLIAGVGEDDASGTAPKQPSLPFALQELEIAGKCTSEMWAHVRYSDGSKPGDKVTKLDILMYDENGTLCARMKGFSSRPLEGELTTPGKTVTDTRAVPPDMNDGITGTIMLTPQWDAFPVEKKPAVPSSSDRVVIIGNLSDENMKTIRERFPEAHVLDTRDEDDIEALTEKLQSFGDIDHIVRIASHETLNAADGDSLIEARRQGVIHCFRTLKALLNLGYGTREPGWTVITLQAQSVRESDMVNPAHASLHGFFGSVAKEYPNWNIRVIDLEEESHWPIDDIFTLPFHPAGDAVAYRDRQWYCRQLNPMQVPQPRENMYRTHGVYVVIGGAGGIGAAWSEYMIRTYNARIAWIGRRREDEDIRAKLETLAKHGTAPIYISADAADRQSLQKAYEEIKRQFSEVHGVIHSAIVLQDQGFANMDEERFQAVFSAKADICVRIAQVFKEELDFVLFFSSVNAFLKSPGQGNYAAGCTFKDAFAHRLSHERSCKVKVMNWGYWGSVGVVASKEYRDRILQAGIGSIEPPEAMTALETLLAVPMTQAALVKITRPGAMKEIINTDRQVTIYPQTLPPVIGEMQQHIEPAQEAGTPLDELIADVTQQRAEMEDLLAKLMHAQLHTMGLLNPQNKTGLIDLYQRWLESSIALLENGDYSQSPGMDSLWKEWEEKKSTWLEKPDFKAHVRLVEATLKALPEILTGKRSAPEVIFPGSSMELVQGVYKNNRAADFFNGLLADTVVAYIEERLKQDPNAALRIIEIGAGTGGTSAAVFPKLQPYASHIREYCYTDISKAFLLHAETQYGPQNPYLSYKIFNAEAPLARQDVTPGGYDIVIAANVLHATANIARTMDNAKALLAKYGLILLNELSHSGLFNHLTFGLLEGWWLYEDPALRLPGSPGLAPGTWQKVLETTGFSDVFFPLPDSHKMGQQIIAAQSNGVARQKVITIEDTSENENNVKTENVGNIENAAPKDDDLKKYAMDIVKQALVDTVKIPPHKIQPGTPFEKYGIDSILQTSLVRQLEKVAGKLSNTLLFEHSTAAELVEYLVSNHADGLSKAFRPPEGLRGLSEGQREDPFGIPKALRAVGSMRRFEVGGKDEDVAVIGIGGRYPLSGSLDELWENLKAGRNCITKASRSRWAASFTRHEQGSENDDYYGGFLEDVDRFDCSLFGIEPGKVTDLAPEIRLFLETTWETFEDAGYSRQAIQALQERSRRGVGVFVGSMYDQYPWSMPSAQQALVASGSTNWNIANRVSHFFNLTGPSIVVNTACSSSITAIHLACESLKRQDCSMAVAGGVNLTLHPAKYDALSQANFLGSGDRNKSFGTGDGFIPSEGVGAVLLKPLSLALRDKDPIHAVIKSSFLNHSGGRQMYSAPDPKQQAQLIADSIEKSRIPAETIGYVESAAGGSKLGDPIETIALKNAFNRYTQKTRFCALGCVKSNLGHLEAASGISQLSKVLLQLKHKTLVPTINATPRNPGIKLEGSPFYIQEETASWEPFREPATGELLPRRSMINSFGAGGSYANLIVEEFTGEVPLPKSVETGDREHLFLFSAATRWSLNRYIAAMQDFLASSPTVAAGEVARSLQLMNHELEYRAAVIASTVEELSGKLKRLRDAEIGDGIYVSVDLPGDLAVDSMLDESSPDPDTIRRLLEERNLEQLAQHWTTGVQVDFRQLYPESRVSPLPLPTYIFDHRHTYNFHDDGIENPVEFDDQFYRSLLERISKGKLSKDEAMKLIR